jgi:hypothetical protein
LGLSSQSFFLFVVMSWHISSIQATVVYYLLLDNKLRSSYKYKQWLSWSWLSRIYGNFKLSSFLFGITICWFCVARYLCCFLWIPLLICFLDLQDSFSHITSETPSSATELRLHGQMESPGFGLRPRFAAERKWALGLQVTFILRSPCNFPLTKFSWVIYSICLTSLEAIHGK